jgi:ubiquinone/menaquinone biosynthesis C-methylase UbiE
MTLETCRQFYNASAGHPMTDPQDPRSFFAVERIYKQLKAEITSGLRVLDLGCGAGRYAYAMEEMGAIPVGIDCASIPLRYANSLRAVRNSRAGFVEGDVCRLPFAADSFDLVLLPGNNIVEYSYEDIDSLASQIALVLKKGGKFCLMANDIFLQQKGSFPENYCVSTGKIVHTNTIPDKGPYEMHVWFWTLAFVKHVIGRHLKLQKEEQVNEKGFWLVFCRN